MMKSSKIILLSGVILIISTWFLGKSQIQTYEDLEVFGGREEYPTHEKITITQQRIKDTVLIPILFVELVGTLTLTVINIKTKNEHLLRILRIVQNQRGFNKNLQK